jgi:hypothetical protein
LSHASEDGCGLRSLSWPEYAESHKDETVGETMTCSGSSWTCRRDTFVNWGGFDERHGTFGQEGCEIACMFWLSGGRFLVHKGTWYAHWNRGKSTYSLGRRVKRQSIEHSHWLWAGDNWPHATRPFSWLIEKFQPPGWPPASAPSDAPRATSDERRTTDPAPRATSDEDRPPSDERRATSDEPRPAGIPAIHQGAQTKGWKCRVGTLWDARLAISDPGKADALAVFWPAFEGFIRGGAPDSAAYRAYLVSRLDRSTRPVVQPSARQLRKIERRMQDDISLTDSIRDNGLLAPLEFYAADGRMILWKGYRRLAILHALGRDREVVPCRVFADRRAAGVLSPQRRLVRLAAEPPGDLKRIAERQFQRWGRDATDKYWVHNYLPYYERHFSEIRPRAKRICEVGLLRGASLALWREYFPKAELFGFDCSDKWKKRAGDLDRLTVITGDETSREDVGTLIGLGPFDAIVDDASHAPAHQRQLFDWLWPSVRQYGWYAIEDVYRNFDPAHPDRNCLPKDLIERIYGTRDVRQVHAYYNIIFVQKG